MGTIASTRRGRQRKAVSDDKVTGKGSHEPAISNGDGQASSNGSQPTAKANGISKKVDWRGLVDAVNAHSGIVSTAWHPEPKSELIGTNASDVRVLVGEPAYQLSTGEIIAL